MFTCNAFNPTHQIEIFIEASPVCSLCLLQTFSSTSIHRYCFTIVFRLLLFIHTSYTPTAHFLWPTAWRLEKSCCHVKNPPSVTSSSMLKDASCEDPRLSPHITLYTVICFIYSDGVFFQVYLVWIDINQLWNMSFWYFMQSTSVDKILLTKSIVPLSNLS